MGGSPPPPPPLLILLLLLLLDECLKALVTSRDSEMNYSGGCEASQSDHCHSIEKAQGEREKGGTNARPVHTHKVTVSFFFLHRHIK